MKKQKMALLLSFVCSCLIPQLLTANVLSSQNTNSTFEISYPLITDLKGGSIKITNQGTQSTQLLSPPYSSIALEPGNYIVEEITAPDGYMPNVNPQRDVVLTGGEAKTVKFYNSLIPEQELSLYYENRTSGNRFLVGADYTGIKIGEYYWMNSNMNHVEPSWTWWTASIGDMTNFPIGQEQLDKYLEQVRLDKSYFQVDTALFHKYYGRYFDDATITYMNSYAKMYEGAEKEITGWRQPYVKEFRQLFAMCPFHSSNKTNILTERDVRFALSAKYGDNPMTNYSIPGECGTTYWFDPRYVTNIYGFNLMPGGARTNRVANGQYASWATNLCGSDAIFQAITGDLYHLFYTAKFKAKDGYASLHDIVDTGSIVSYHWYNMRWCRKMTDAELGYRLYIKADDAIMASEDWAAFVGGNETNLLLKIQKGIYDPESFDVVATEYSPNDDIAEPEGYVEFPNGYIRGFYVQYAMDERHGSTSLRNAKSAITIKDILSMAGNIQDIALGAVKTSTGIEQDTVDEDENIKVYPNPVANILSIELKDQIISVSLYTTSGIFIKSLASANQINVSDLASGIYILNVETANKVHTKRIMKK